MGREARPVRCYVFQHAGTGKESEGRMIGSLQENADSPSLLKMSNTSLMKDLLGNQKIAESLLRQNNPELFGLLTPRSRIQKYKGDNI